MSGEMRILELTWAVFSIYCLDNFPEKDAMQVIQEMETQMINKRGFIKFESFNQQLIKVYLETPGMSIDSLYNQILEWASKQ